MRRRHRTEQAKRATNGAEFRLNHVPPEFSQHGCFYINPAHALKIGFAARWIYDQVSMEKEGKIVQRPICPGIILMENELRRGIQQGALQRLSKAEIDNMVRDCYELIVAFIRGKEERFGRVGIQPHIYELPGDRLSKYSRYTDLSPDILAASRPVQIV
jgi:hypothetical protein